MIIKKILFLLAFSTLIAPFVLAPHYPNWDTGNGVVVKKPSSKCKSYIVKLGANPGITEELFGNYNLKIKKVGKNYQIKSNKRLAKTEKTSLAKALKVNGCN